MTPIARPRPGLAARHRRGVARARAYLLGALALAAALAPAAGHGAPTAPTGPIVRVALLADQPQWPAAEAAVGRLLASLGEQRLDFVVHAGGIKGDTESCGDHVLDARERLLDASPLPLVYVPGEAEWAECQRAASGSFDPLERLNRLRELFYASDASLGQRTIPLMRQSDQATFRSFRENVRWRAGPVMMVGMNLPGDNNHYLAEGGRNGEFEDRREANHQWLARAFFLAQQQNLAGLVLVVHGDPQFGNGWEHRGRPTLLDAFVSRRKRDGFLEFKRQLRELTARFRGQVLLIHASLKGFGIDTPLRDANGKTLRNFKRITLPTGASGQWAELRITPASPELFSVSVKDAPGGTGEDGD
ncbi:hypothetical protein [Cupriavidus malaysiensis]|uniref:hypothetical protein n=1 Tax=Cupriavidus malaysiensis TaxID=367825 RepID=UPI000A985AA3|nr:hypothetical protein [Cupriavidus malaysiensis]